MCHRMLVALTLAASAWVPAAGAEEPRGSKSGEAWLGVVLTPVPAALAAHLELDDRGLMIRNVFRDSPAEKAGLDRYHVIVEADGEPLQDSVESFSRYVREKQPGDALKLTVYQTGQKSELTITLGDRPADWEELDLKYEDDPDVSRWRNYGLRGKIFRHGPEGWSMEELEELPEFQELQKRLRPYLDELWGDDVAEGHHVDADGRVLHVRRDADGMIEVRRYHVSKGESSAEVTRYKSLAELKAQDREAYDLLQAAGPRGYRWDRGERDGWGFGRRPLRPRPLHPGSPGWREWHRKFFGAPFDELLDREGRRPGDQDARPGQERPSKEPREGADRGPGRRPLSPEARERARHAEAADPGVTTRFEVDVDGRVTVWLREGDTELSRTYESQEAFRQDAPELYEQFEAMKKKMR